MFTLKQMKNFAVTWNTNSDLHSFEIRESPLKSVFEQAHLFTQADSGKAYENKKKKNKKYIKDDKYSFGLYVSIIIRVLD